MDPLPNHVVADDDDQRNPWIEVWVRPRKTIAWILEKDNGITTILVLLFSGAVYHAFGQAEWKNHGDHKEISSIFLSTIFLGGTLGVLVYILFVWSVDFCSSWIGGRGSFRKTLTAFAWSMVPCVAGLLLCPIAFALFEEELFTSDTPIINADPLLTRAFWAYGVLEVTFGLWHFGLIVILISEVQRYSIGKAVFSLVMGILLLVTPIVVLLMLP